MNNQSQVTPVIRVDNTDIPVTVYQDLRVITTELLAQVYGTDTDNLKKNFTRNESRFQNGVHYFKLEGIPLRDFKSLSPQIPKQARHLILWTERGAARHAKMLDTDQAWDVFDKLESAYFEQTITPEQPYIEQQPRQEQAVPLDGRILLTIRNGQIVSSEPLSEKVKLFDPYSAPSIRSWVFSYIPARHLHLVMEAVTERSLAISSGMAERLPVKDKP